MSEHKHEYNAGPEPWPNATALVTYQDGTQARGLQFPDRPIFPLHTAVFDDTDADLACHMPHRFTTGWALVAALGLGLIALSLAMAKAKAGDSMSLSCVGGGGAVSCTVTRGGFGPAHVIKVSPATDPDSERRDRQWWKLCSPKVVLDRFGVRRYAYTKPGCEYGRYK